MMLIQTVTLSKAWVCVRKHAGVAGSNGRHECLFRVSVVCCQVDVFCIGLITRPEVVYFVWVLCVVRCLLHRADHPSRGCLFRVSVVWCQVDVFCIGLITRPEFVYFVWVLCVVRCLCLVLITRPEVSYRVLCEWVRVWSLDSEALAH